MINVTIDSILVVIISIGLILVLTKTKTMNKNTIFIVASLLAFWFLMYMQKNSSFNKYKIETEIGGSLGKWVWPIIAGLYQLMQVAMRLPYGKLSQKLGSRKQIVQISFFLVLISLTMMIASGLATWSLIVAAIAMGQYGSTFGLDSQYISENHNIKKVFTSSAIAFIIPVLGSLMSSVVYQSFDFANNFSENTYYWMIFVTLMLGFVSFIMYSLLKEDVSTIHLDNVDPSAQVFVKRNYKDIWAVSLTAAFMAFAYNFALGFYSMEAVEADHFWVSILLVISLGGSVLVGLFLKKYVNGRFIRILSLSLMLISLILTGVLFITGDINKTAFVILLAFASISFGMYVMALFGAALHFDHKYPALVLGIFLTVKSFALGTSTISNKMVMVATSSNQNVGIIIIAVSSVFILASLISSMFIVNRLVDNDMDKLIDDSFGYELGRKLVVGNRKVIN